MLLTDRRDLARCVEQTICPMAVTVTIVCDRAHARIAAACKVEDQSKRAASGDDGSRDADARRCIARCASWPRDFRLVHANGGSIAVHPSAPGDTEGLNCEIDNFARRCDQLFNNGDLGGTMNPGASVC
ncbi:PREDICTED: uncharacterized protein LOC108764571 [Trachymyrmex cornetzi]|uniref:uncharacterized protein LOC108764571 n=1 Tax=Trachymyrmex cornetzi TaxID=471704 RepID=UPI00084F297D|nr:PREDICTED: uncharacterized protein LOC108764571 [Trachymyrmex cornetzi]